MNEHKKQFGKAIVSGQTEVWKVLLRFLYEVIQGFAIKKNRKDKKNSIV